MFELAEEMNSGIASELPSPDEHTQTTRTVRSYLADTPGHWEITLKSSTDVPTVLLQTAIGVLRHTIRVDPRQTAAGETVYAVDETHSATPEYTPIGKYRVLQNALREARDRLAYLESDDF